MTPELQAMVDRIMGLADAFDRWQPGLIETGRLYHSVAVSQKAEARAALRTAIEELAQQADARDAARWRELRDGASDLMLCYWSSYEPHRAPHEVADYDAAIDAAMAASKKEG